MGKVFWKILKIKWKKTIWIYVSVSTGFEIQWEHITFPKNLTATTEWMKNTEKALNFLFKLQSIFILNGKNNKKVTIFLFSFISAMVSSKKTIFSLHLKKLFSLGKANSKKNNKLNKHTMDQRIEYWAMSNIGWMHHTRITRCLLLLHTHVIVLTS